MPRASDFENKKGTSTLRSRHMNYSRNVLNHNWHCAREAEPKDYDISRGPVRNFHTSTYKRLASSTNGELPKSTYQDHFHSITLKPYYSELDRDRPMVDRESLIHTYIDRYTGDPKEDFASVLPRHHPNYVKYGLHIRPNAGFDPFEPEPPFPADFPDKSKAFRKCNSQFTDRDDYRRPGWNTFLDESGIYANTHFKRQVFMDRNPIPDHALYMQDQPQDAKARAKARLLNLGENSQPGTQVRLTGSAPKGYDANLPFRRIEAVPRKLLPQVPNSVDGKLVHPNAGQEVSGGGPVADQEQHCSTRVESTTRAACPPDMFANAEYLLF